MLLDVCHKYIIKFYFLYYIIQLCVMDPFPAGLQISSALCPEAGGIMEKFGEVLGHVRGRLLITRGRRVCVYIYTYIFV